MVEKLKNQKTMNNFNITLFEACEILNRSKKSISRYIRRGLLHPKRVKSQQGTLEYRFDKEELEAFKHRQEQTGQIGQDRQDKTDTPEQTEKEQEAVIEPKTEQPSQDTPAQPRHDETHQTGQDNEVVTLLKETTGILKNQLKTKDDQIKGLGDKIDQLIERDRETNIILKGLQDKVLMLGQPKEQNKPENEAEVAETPIIAVEVEKTHPETQRKPLNTNKEGVKDEEPKKNSFWRNVFIGDTTPPPTK